MLKLNKFGGIKNYYYFYILKQLIMSTSTLTVNQVTYERLKKEYQKSVKNKVEVFIFDGHEFLTDYAKYLLKFLKPNFEN